MSVQQSFGYSLAAFEQPANTSQYIQRFTAEYIQRYELFINVERYATIIGNFMRFCPPKGVTIAGIEAVCMFTSLSFFVDDQLENYDSRYLESYQAILTGRRLPQSKPEQALLELLNFAEALSQSSQISQDSFRQHLSHYFAAQQWERDVVKRERYRFTEADYRRYRPDAIALLPYLALLKLAEHIDEQRFAPLQKTQLVYLEQLSAKIAYLDNDLYSWESEQDEPTALNLVKVIKEQSGLSWQESLQRVITLRNRTVEEFIHIRDAALAEADAAELRRYIELMEYAMTGNFEAMKQLKLNSLRYQLPANCLAAVA